MVQRFTFEPDLSGAFTGVALRVALAIAGAPRVGHLDIGQLGLQEL
jgi:hypothetical protein